MRPLAHSQTRLKPTRAPKKPLQPPCRYASHPSSAATMGVTEAERDTLSDNHCATDVSSLRRVASPARAGKAE